MLEGRVTPLMPRRLVSRASTLGARLDVKEVQTLGNKLRWVQVLIILFALVGLFAVQSTRAKRGVLTHAA